METRDPVVSLDWSALHSWRLPWVFFLRHGMWWKLLGFLLAIIGFFAISGARPRP
jgi:hypothetical protein